MVVLLGTVLRLLRVSRAVSPGRQPRLAAVLIRTGAPVRPPGTLSITLRWRRRRPISPRRLLRAIAPLLALALPLPRLPVSLLSPPPRPVPISQYRARIFWATSPGGAQLPAPTVRTLAPARPAEPL